MKSEEIKTLALDLVRADTERDVIRVLRKYELWDDERVWAEFDESSGNWSTIGNQQSAADTALVEKLINSVDAILMKECYHRGVLPASNDAPASIEAAQREYFGIYNGKLSSIDAAARARIAGNIYLVATGGKKNPSFSIIDKGEGQRPEDFANTFLSLNRGNKNKVPFVQGKFGMGGTGALSFCSPEHNLQLIISRRDTDIVDESQNPWGVTVIRRVDPTGQMKCSIFKYLAPQGQILSFEAASLPLLPGRHPIAYGEPLRSGSFIKLYEYDIAARFRSNIRIDLFYRLSMLLPNIALPITLCERRDYSDKEEKTGDMMIIMSGLSVRLDEDKRGNLEEGFPSTGGLTVRGQEMDYSIYAFRKDKRKTYSGNEGIIFTVNGQAHGFFSTGFYDRKSVRMSYLSDSILILIDCTAIDKRRQEDLFMNSRDRLRDVPLKDDIEEKLEEIIKNHQGLRALQTQRRREDVEGKLKDSKPLADVLEKIIKKSPSLSSLFANGVRIINPFSSQNAGEADKFEGKEFPTFFRLAKEYSPERPKQCPINNRHFRVQFETDAENDYFDRDKDPGQITINLNNSALEESSFNLWNGVGTLSVDLSREVEVGDILHFKAEVNDIRRVDPFMGEFWVKIMEQQMSHSNSNGERKKPYSEDEGSDRQAPGYLALPTIVEVRRDKWEQYGFDEKSALKVQDAVEEGGYDFFINMDNVYLQVEVKENTRVDPRILEARYMYGMILFGVTILGYEEKKSKSDAGARGEDESEKSKIADFSRAISPALLPMISSLGDLEIED